MCSCLPLADHLVSIMYQPGVFHDLLLQIRAMDTLQPHVGHTTSDDVEASGDRDDVKLILFTVSRLDALFSEFLNLVAVLLGDVNYLNIVTIEDLVVILFKARTLDTESMRWL